MTKDILPPTDPEEPQEDENKSRDQNGDSGFSLWEEFENLAETQLGQLSEQEVIEQQISDWFSRLLEGDPPESTDHVIQATSCLANEVILSSPDEIFDPLIDMTGFGFKEGRTIEESKIQIAHEEELAQWIEQVLLVGRAFERSVNGNELVDHEAEDSTDNQMASHLDKNTNNKELLMDWIKEYANQQLGEGSTCEEIHPKVKQWFDVDRDQAFPQLSEWLDHSLTVLAHQVFQASDEKYVNVLKNVTTEEIIVDWVEQVLLIGRAFEIALRKGELDDL